MVHGGDSETHVESIKSIYLLSPQFTDLPFFEVSYKILLSQTTNGKNIIYNSSIQ